MKYAKMLGMLAVAAAALMAFAGSASATILTEKVAGNHVQVSVNDSIHATNTGIVTLDGSLIIECSVSTVEGSVSNEGGPSESETVEGAISVLSFENCGSRTVTVVSPGSLIVHTDTTEGSTYGLLTSNLAKVTVLAHLPFNVTTHCIYTTSNTTIGTVTSSDHREATGDEETAELHADAVINRESTDFGCGTTGNWTGTYSITTPMHLDVD